MNIESSAIRLAGQHASSRYFAIEETLRAWSGTQRPDAEGRATEGGAFAALTVAISDVARQADAKAQSVAAGPGTPVQRKVSVPYVGHVVTPFDLKDSATAPPGALRASAVYLQSSGSAQTPQRVDLVA